MPDKKMICSGEINTSVPNTTLLYIVANVSMFFLKQTIVSNRDLAETIESGPLCTTDLFKNKSVAYYLFISAFI